MLGLGCCKMEKLSSTDKIIHNLFDPRIKRYKIFVDDKHRQAYQSIPLKAKLKYIEYYLNVHWAEICGEHLAKNCAVDKLQEDTLHIRTSSSLLANELYMMKKLLLQKINRALTGGLIIKDLKFHTGNIKLEKFAYAPEEEKPQEVGIIRCPKCDAKMLATNQLCNVCEREERHKLQQSIIDLLKISPWLKYEACQEHIPCARVTFNDAKELLKNFYYEKVRLGYANDTDCLMAVMLLTEKSVTELNDKIYQNSLEFLRRSQDVSASRV